MPEAGSGVEEYEVISQAQYFLFLSWTFESSVNFLKSQNFSDWPYLERKNVSKFNMIWRKVASATGAFSIPPDRHPYRAGQSGRDRFAQTSKLVPTASSNRPPAWPAPYNIYKILIIPIFILIIILHLGDIIHKYILLLLLSNSQTSLFSLFMLIFQNGHMSNYSRVFGGKKVQKNALRV